MEDIPMIAQGLRNNWKDSGELIVTRSGLEVEECWRWWAHNPHTSRGPDGQGPLTTCRGRRWKQHASKVCTD